MNTLFVMVSIVAVKCTATNKRQQPFLGIKKLALKEAAPENGSEEYHIAKPTTEGGVRTPNCDYPVTDHEKCATAKGLLGIKSVADLADPPGVKTSVSFNDNYTCFVKTSKVHYLSTEDDTYKTRDDDVCKELKNDSKDTEPSYSIFVNGVDSVKCANPVNKYDECVLAAKKLGLPKPVFDDQPFTCFVKSSYTLETVVAPSVYDTKVHYLSLKNDRGEYDLRDGDVCEGPEPVVSSTDTKNGDKGKGRKSLFRLPSVSLSIRKFLRRRNWIQ